MGRAPYPSVVTMPVCSPPYPTILEFLAARFPAVGVDVWQLRMAAGAVSDGHGGAITEATPYQPQGRIFYFREVAEEPVIPFAEEILHLDDELLVACKPHFLPVTPGGRFVNECLLERLRRRTGIDELAPLHRIDRETAGIVMFSVNRGSRALYSSLFRDGRVTKMYEAVSTVVPSGNITTWQVENRIVHGEPWFRMQVVPGGVNARSTLQLTGTTATRGIFTLYPHTGKTHQLRLHLSGIGCGILHDRYYPVLQAEREDDFTRPLQLLARRIAFTDPLSGRTREYVSGRNLLPPD